MTEQMLAQTRTNLTYKICDAAIRLLDVAICLTHTFSLINDHAGMDLIMLCWSHRAELPSMRDEPCSPLRALKCVRSRVSHMSVAEWLGMTHIQ